jgi:molybdopterin-guanine dinucleotide biosynthesis protein A
VVLTIIIKLSMDQKTLSGFVLAGGKSSRLGEDKAMLNYKGKPLLIHSLEIIRPFCQNLYVSGNKPEYSIAGVELMPDLYHEYGPISGLFSVLNRSETDWNLVISVDVPLINSDLIELLIANKNDYDCIVPRHSLCIEPLIGVYHKKAITTMKELIESEDFRLTNLLSALNTNYFDCDFLLNDNPGLFLNVNRPDDYQLISGI